MSGAVFDGEGRVLLVRQSYVAGWRLPGGGVGRGEPPDAAMRRELAEEVGLSGGAVRLCRLLCPQGRMGQRAGRASTGSTAATVNFRPNLEMRDICFADPRRRRRARRRGTLRRLAELTGAPQSRLIGELAFWPAGPISENRDEHAVPDIARSGRSAWKSRATRRASRR